METPGPPDVPLDGVFHRPSNHRRSGGGRVVAQNLASVYTLGRHRGDDRRAAGIFD